MRALSCLLSVRRSIDTASLARRVCRSVTLLAVMSGFGPIASAQPSSAAAQPNQVVVAGTVPDEATRNAILARVRDIYGADRVVDQLGVGPVVAPANWSAYVQKLLSPQLKQVSRGQLAIQGNNVELKGEVSSEPVKQQLAADVAASLNPTYLVRNGLRVAVQEQAVLDDALANRIIEFEPSSSMLRPSGILILDQIATTLVQLGGKRVEVIGHTDSQGNRDANIALSLERAESVRNHLMGKGIAASLITTSGIGPDRPVASNDTAEGRARNRRIEFRISN